MSYPSFASLQAGYARLWADLEPAPAHMPALRTIAAAILAHKLTYQEVARTVWGKPDPWVVVALIDQMEHEPEYGLCNSHLHNGDSLAARTMHVPAGRPPAPSMPPFGFVESAIDALRYEGLDQVAAWTVERLAYWLERYNGGGYLALPGENPYLAGWSNRETPGRYTSDHHYDPDARPAQPGALTVLKLLIDADPTIAAALSLAAEPGPSQAQPQESPMTQSPAPADTFDKIEQALTAVSSWLPSLLTPIALVFPPAAAILRFLPLIQVAIQAVKVVKDATGQNTAAAAQTVMAHLTPGQPSASALS